MRKVLMLCALLVVALAGANLEASTVYVGLYADEAHSVTSVDYAGAVTEFDVWVWWLPSEHGLIANSFRLAYPSNVTWGTITLNPNTMPNIGCNDGWEPMCAIFSNCELDWVWSHHQRCYLTDAMPSAIQIVPPDPDPIEAANCEMGNPLDQVVVLNRLNMNWWFDAAEPQTWGAIKSLYR
jgi:hypothetical protein